MDGNEIAFFNRAVQFAQEGNKEKAFEYLKMLAQRNANDMDLILWAIYTAPNIERAEILLKRANLLKPDDISTRQAEQWLTNTRNNWPQPAGGFVFFPPKRYITQPPVSTQIIMPVQQFQAAQQSPMYNIQPQTFIAPQPIIINMAPTYTCPYCRSPMPPLTSTRVSTGGWVTFVVLLLLFFPLCWIGFFSKTSYQYCGQCGVKFN